ncbi:unnamed protein product [Closterium sp. NIES-54]
MVFLTVAAAMHANPMAVLFDSGCSHYLMGTKEAIVNIKPRGDVKRVRGFNGALQTDEGRGTSALQGEAGKRVLIPDVLYVPAVQAKLLTASQLKDSGVKLQDVDDEMLLASAAGDVLGRPHYTGLVFWTDLRPCSTKLLSASSNVVAVRAIASATNSMPDM